LNYTRILALAAAAFVLFAALGNVVLSDRLEHAQTQIQELETTAQDAADSAAAAMKRANKAERTRDSIKVMKIHPQLRKQSIARAHADSAVRAAPDTCAPVIAALKADVAATSELAASYLEAYNTEVAAHEDTKVSLADAQLALAGLAVKAGAIELPSQSWVAKLLPKAYVGCTAGMSPITLRADVVCGPSLGWQVAI
jgi:hypothetical protein